MSFKKNTGSSTAARRLMTEYRQLINDPPEGISAGPVDEEYAQDRMAKISELTNLSNFFEWECLIQGPEDTPYDGGLFAATLSFPQDYPLSPPKLKFTSNIFHPNGE